MRRLALALGALVLLGSGTAAAAEEPPKVVAAYRAEGVPARADDPAWDAAPAAELPLMAQMIAPPVGGGSADRVDVRALHDGDWLGIRLAWADSTADRSVGVDRFRDAAAVGFPEEATQGPTSPFMGDAEHPVRIWQWTADLEAARGGTDPSAERYPETEGVWYFPYDDEITTWVHGWRGREPVGVFVATGFGELERLSESDVEGRSLREPERWSVVLRRRLGGDGVPAFAPGLETQVIVAVWDGHGAEVNGRKSVTMSWTPFVLAPLEESHAAR